MFISGTECKVLQKCHDTPVKEGIQTSHSSELFLYKMEGGEELNNNSDIFHCRRSFLKAHASYDKITNRE